MSDGSSNSRRSRDLGVFAAGVLAGASAIFLFDHRRRCRRQRSREGGGEITCPDSSSSSSSSLPRFAQSLSRDPNLHRVRLREWEDLEWRASMGWRGRDLCHDPDGRAVRVLDYYYDDRSGKEDQIQEEEAAAVTGAEGAKGGDSNGGSAAETRRRRHRHHHHQLIGVVWFGPLAESHRGLCHGGAMTSLMDDFCGHAAFVTSDSPWSGATVQVNVSLKRPVPVGSVLRIAGGVKERKGRKVFVEAVLDDGGRGEGDDGEGGEAPPTVYATMDGLSIDGVKMSSKDEHADDEVSARTWEVDVCGEGRLHRKDSGWKIR